MELVPAKPGLGGGLSCARRARARFAGCMKRSPPLNFWSASDMLLVCDSRRLRPPNAPPRRACILHLYKPGSREWSVAGHAVRRV